jgi:D-lyxose ketol-isomerase
MKRSQINAIIRDADAFIRSQGFYLPPFAYWTPQDWGTKGPEVREIVENNLGWDITDYGRGDFSDLGLFLFTIRNGNSKNLDTMSGKLYAEKIMVVGENQITPMHFHWKKMEDIINRGGAKLAIQLYQSTPEEGLDFSRPVEISLDGVVKTFSAGTTVELEPGESISLPGYCYHKFWGSGGRVLVGEVSMVNDDHTDNRFFEAVGRFPDIEEDEAPLHLLVNDYGQYYRQA